MAVDSQQGSHRNFLKPTAPIPTPKARTRRRANRGPDDCDEASGDLPRRYHQEREQPTTVSHATHHLALAWLTKAWGPLPGWAWLLLTTLSVLVFGYNLGPARSLTEHETYVAAPAKQMVTEGDYILPRIGTHPWVEKPPLPYWLSAVACAAADEFTERNVRLPSVLAGLCVVLIVAGLNARWYGAIVGILAGITQATCVYMVTYARLAEADMLLAAVVVAAIGAFDRFRFAVDQNHGTAMRLWRAMFWILIGLTGLIKGFFFGAVLVAAPCLLWDAWSRRLSISRRLFSVTGVAFVLLTWMAWPAVVVARDPVALKIWYDHLMGRVTGRIDFNNEPFWYYLTTWPWQMLPWTPLLVVATWSSLVRAWRDGLQPDRFVWCWAVVPLLLLSLSRGKHHHYLIYSLPALSSIVALGLDECGRRIREQTRATRILATVYIRVIAPGAIAIGGVIAMWSIDHRLDALFLSSLIAGGAMLLGWTSSRRNAMGAYASVLFPMILAIIYVHYRVLPDRDRSAADRVFLRSVRQEVPDKVPLVVCGSSEKFGREIARHIFYIDREVVPAWCPADLSPIDQTVYVVSRRRSRSAFATLGNVTEVAASAHSRHEQEPEDRFALFRLEPRTQQSPRTASVVPR